MAERRKKAESTTPVKALRHKGETRSNIPTAETEAFAAKAEARPVDLLYPRDPSLDPQLVWKGKDEQDQEPLKVPAVPIYIQETIEPQAIIEDLRLRTRAESDQPDLFGDAFSDLEFEERVDFYKHAGKWTNRMILGDSLMVMASLAEKEALKGQVQMIYIDPPYGIKFNSNWQVSTRAPGVSDGRAADVTRQPEQVRAFRDTWELGIHSYLNYLRDRLVLARELLTPSGSVFLQIGDQNIHLARSVMDEVFGSSNFVTTISFSKTTSSTSPYLGGTVDYILWFAKERDRLKYRQLFRTKSLEGEGASMYTRIELADGTRRQMTDEERSGRVALPPSARAYRLDNLTSQAMGRAKGEGAASWFEVSVAGRRFKPSMQARWKTNEEGMERLLLANRLEAPGDMPQYVRFLEDFPGYPYTEIWSDVGGATGKRYVVETNVRVIARCLLMTTDPGDLVLDPTCGSGSTAFSAEQWGRRWITIDTSRVALSLARTRLMNSAYPYYLLADSPEGALEEAARAGRAPVHVAHTGDIRRGFVYQRIPHVTLGSIATNQGIKKGMSKEAIEDAVRLTAETELLYDRPVEAPRVVRVTGPFTVESLSPHRVLVTGPEDQEAASETHSHSAAEFVESVLENLRRAGVQNTYKDERLVLETLEPYPGVYVQAVGSYPEAGKSRIAAVAIGPEFGTVGKELIREAAKEAVAFGADVLIVAGFAFEALVEGEEKIGKLVVLKTKMNPDLQMPDLLKKTGAGNLFMVFGEPDIDIRTKDEDEEVIVEVRGLDVYDPTTGEVRSNSTDDIACWFIDTNYNGESFFVRHAYFIGADDPYEKLRKALKADIDEAAWASLNSTVSRPFKSPTTGKIAVKVINHYGDEILKVYEV